MSTAMNANLEGDRSTVQAQLNIETLQREGQAIVAALDNAPLTRRHVVFLAALLGALIFDYAKPFTISFVIPGMKMMWGLSTTTASLLAVFGLTGTVIGSVFWGFMADRIGRRSTLLWTVAIFSIASLCGLAVQYWNSLLACLVMGFGVGGETPIVFALAAEYIPAKIRGRTLLFLGMIGALGGYLFAAIIATIFKSFLPETEAWRYLWLVNIIPGIMILVLRSRVVPESARYLIHHGRMDEARAAAESLIGRLQPVKDLASIEKEKAPVMTGVLPRLYGRTVALSFFSFAAGLANFGFITWLPTLLGSVGYSGAGSSALLAVSALVALPALAVTTFVLIRLGTRGTLVAYAVGGGLALLALGLGVSAGFLAPAFLVVVVSAVFFFITSIGGTFSFYGAEVFPTAMRVRRSGIVAAFGKVGGVIGPFLGGLWLAGGGSWLGLQAPLAIVLVAAAIVLGVIGVETHGRTLEQIAAA